MARSPIGRNAGPLSMVPAALIALGAISLVAFPTFLVPAAASPEPNLAGIDAYIVEEMRDVHIPGLALGIVHNDEVVHLRGFGEAGPPGRGVTPQTPFILASASKSFTALAIMQLVESGKVDLDAPVRRYLPDFDVARRDRFSEDHRPPPAAAHQRPARGQRVRASAQQRRTR